MKVIHIESGLGNQMLSYCEFIAIKKMNPQDRCFIETMIYEIQECNDTICQWNGYELERVFGIKETNIKEQFCSQEWEEIIDEVKQSKFWEKRWNYPVYITKAFKHHGIELINELGNFEKQEEQIKGARGVLGFVRGYFTERTALGNWLRRTITMRKSPVKTDISLQSRLFLKSDNDVFTGQRLFFKRHGSGIELIENEIARHFIFPSLDEKNKEFASFLCSCNSVFIHARRGDMLSSNGWCYKYGYFRRAVKHIKKNVMNPVFVFFTNTGSIGWCKENAGTFGLDFSKDKVYFVDWNTGKDSYKDMQLMGCCKHGIITNSTFGWWGAYFIKNPNKITISPLAEINTTYHC